MVVAADLDREKDCTSSHPDNRPLEIRLVRGIALIVAALAFGFGAILVTGPTFRDLTLPEIVYAVAAAGAGFALLAAAGTASGRVRVGWGLVGAGVMSWALGEAVWMIQGRNGEIPYPGIADFFYVVGYPLIFAGVLFLPYLRPGRFERLRLSIDAAAGTISLAVVMWIAYLDDVVAIGTDPVETFLNVLYPFGDVFLGSALMVLAMRRSEQRLDLRVLLLAGAVALTALADVVFSLQTASEVYVEWGWLDGVWLFSYALFAMTAFYVTRPARPREASYRSSRGWQLVAPYGAVAVLFLVRLATSQGNDMLLDLSTTAVAGLIVLRQSLAAREKRELLERQRDDLVASVSHELRTPLTGIQGYAQLLGESWELLTDAERSEMLATIDDQARHLGLIVSDLIDVARDRLQNVALSRVEYKADDLVREAVIAAGAEDKVRTSGDPNARVFVDPGRMRQVIVNLITNAVRYGGPNIVVTVRRRRANVAIAVHDDGPGVPHKFQAVMWDRFERGEHQGNNKVAGSGIGLSVARELVNAHGGSIGYRASEILGGACFEFTLPVLERAQDALVGAGITG